MTNNNEKCCQRCINDNVGWANFGQCMMKDCNCHTSPVSKEQCKHPYGTVENGEYNCKECGEKNIYNAPSPIAEQEGWEKEFAEKFKDSFSGGDMNSWERAEPIKSFIRQTLSSHNLALVEAVKAMKKSPQNSEDYVRNSYGAGRLDDFNSGFNSALDAVIEIIKPK